MLLSNAKCEGDKLRFNKVKAAHREVVTAERQVCSKRTELAVEEPNKYLLIEMDSMDQQKAAIPHLREKPKALDPVNTVPYHVTAARIPGYGVLEWVYNNNLAHDSNTTVTILHRALQEVHRTRGFLPPTLFLQLDNCTRENKNHNMFAYLANLVEQRVFKKVELGFLPVGCVISARPGLARVGAGASIGCPAA